MYVPSDDMKINRFQQVAIPKPSEYMRRFGALRAPANQYTGDELVPPSGNKVDMLAYADQYDAMMQREEDRKAQQNSDHYNKDEHS